MIATGNHLVPPPPMHLVVVDSDLSVADSCRQIAKDRFVVFSATTPEQALNFLRTKRADIVLLDLDLPSGGMKLLDAIREASPGSAVIVMTAFGTVASAVEGIRNGATDYLTKTFSAEDLLRTLERTREKLLFDEESGRLREKLKTALEPGSLIGRSEEMQKVFRLLSKVSFTEHPVLILGENGTGKQRLARAIHAYGSHAGRPFVAVDCGSMVRSLIERELFGDGQAAFNGASQNNDGLLAAADSGTVLLDEIGELPLELQARLLRALQDREVRPVGANYAVPLRARILASTNRDLGAMVEQGQFRKDLYFRLNVVNIRVPALRNRRDDIPLLAEHFLNQCTLERGQKYTLSDAALQLLSEYDWPGNVRELENAVARACALSSGPLVGIADMPTQIQDFQLQSKTRTVEGPGATLDPEEDDPAQHIISIAEMEKQAILSTIRRLHGDKLQAARLLGIGKTTLYRKLKEYGIDEGK